MERRRQTFDEIISNLSRIESEWKDDHAKLVMDLLDRIEERSSYATGDLQKLLEEDFEAGMTLIRLFLDFSKDELVGSLRDSLEGERIGVTAFRRDPGVFIQSLVSLGVLEKMREVVGTPVTWRDVLVERLKTGRGSAIKAQSRGRFLEDKVEESTGSSSKPEPSR